MSERENKRKKEWVCVCVRKRDTVCGLDRERKKEREGEIKRGSE